METGVLNEPTVVADIGNAADSTFDPRRRMVGERRRRPIRPFCLGAAQPTLQEPTQQITPAARWRSRSVEKALAVEVIGDRAGVIARHAVPIIQFTAPQVGKVFRLTRMPPAPIFRPLSQENDF